MGWVIDNAKMVRGRLLLPALVWITGAAVGSLVTVLVAGPFPAVAPRAPSVLSPAAALAPVVAEPAQPQRAAVPDAAAPDAGAPSEAGPSKAGPSDAGAVARAEPMPDKTDNLTVKRGDTLMELMLSAGIARRDAYEAISALSTVYDPRDLLPGQVVTVTYRPEGPDEETRSLRGVDFSPDVERVLSVSRDDKDHFSVSEIKKALERRPARASGTIQSSLYVDGKIAGVPPDVLVELIRIFSWDVDFQRDIRPGDAFDIVFDQFYDEAGAHARNGDVVYASLTLSGKVHRLYRYAYGDGLVDYFDENGRSARKPLLRTPIDGARLSSRFGKRRHPILGYTKMHRGVDFAAATGTPIYAAGDGRIEMAGRNGGYGRYVRIHHNARYATAYAHLSRFASGIRRGKRVRQGQVIGYVGTTGRSTGPHLHYEILVRGSQVNPLSVKLPAGKILAGKELAAFQEERGAVERLVASLSPITSVAQND